MDKFIQGTCDEMCSKDEQQMRIKEKLLHFYEMYPTSNNKTLSNKPINFILVKLFARSAAGVRQPKPSDLRTISALQKTIDYLFKKILIDVRKPFYFVYDFIFDRLRSVRQEIVIQNLDPVISVRFIEPMILFLAYSRYRLADETIENFDRKICDQHLQECLKTVLCLYDELDECGSKKSYNLTKRIIIECIYLLFNLGTTDTLMRALKLSHSIRINSLFHRCFSMSLNFYNKQYYKVLHQLNQLPHILSCVAICKLQQIRWYILCTFAVAYQSRTLGVPLAWLEKLLLYTNSNTLISDCQYYGLEVNTTEGNVQFSRSAFDKSLPVIPVHKVEFVDKNLCEENLSNLILMQ